MSPPAGNLSSETVTVNRTGGTFGGKGSAMLLTELNQQFIYSHPVFARKDFHQGIFALFRVSCVGPAEEVGNAMHMGIHADAVNV